MQKYKKVRAFTLIELLVVMAIIALLLLATLAGLTYGLKKARDTRRQKAVSVVQTALQAYYADYNTYVPYTAVTAAGGTCTAISGAPNVRRCDITALVGLDSTGAGPSATPENAPRYQYFEENFISPIGIQAGKDLDNAMGYYVDDAALSYAVCVVTELPTSGNVTPASNVNDEGTNWGCYCVGPLSETARCAGLEDPNGLPN